MLGLLLAFVLVGAGKAAYAADAATDPRLAEQSIGSPKAPIVIDEYFSLDCPHCAMFAETILPQLKAEYIDKGKVRLVLHDFPLHQISLSAAMLARCMPHDRYVPMIDTLFKTQLGWAGQPTADGQLGALKQQAKFAGLSDSQIDACLMDRSLENAMLQARLDAQTKVKVAATPTLVLNGDIGNAFSGVPGYDVLKKKIDSMLAK